MENRSGLLPIEPDPRMYTVAEFLELLRIAGVDEATRTALADALREHFAELRRKAEFSATVRTQMAVRAARDGESGGRLPLGYTRVDTGVVIDEGGASTVRRIFYLKARGLSLRGIAAQLNAEHTPTSYGGKKWQASSVRQIVLQEAIYRGAQRGDSPLCWPMILPPAFVLKSEPLWAQPARADIQIASADPGASASNTESPPRPLEFPLQLSVDTAGQHAPTTLLALDGSAHGVPTMSQVEGSSGDVVSAVADLANASAFEQLVGVNNVHNWAELLPGFSPSELQAEIFRTLLDETTDIMVSAVAGAGKSTTLVQASRLIHKDTIFVAFNSHIVKALNEKLAGTRATARTLHSIGNGCLWNALIPRGSPIKMRDPDDNKYRKLAREAVQDMQAEHPHMKTGDAIDALYELANKCRETLTDPSDLAALLQLVHRFKITLPEADEDGSDWDAEAVLTAVPMVLTRGEEQARKSLYIDFIDMVYLPVKWNLQPKQFTFVFADEAQDFNRAQQQLLLRCRKPSGRIIFVGDSNQAIMAFAGSEPESFRQLQDMTGAVIKPLSICYRCPKSHIRLAQQIVPEIQPAPNAEEGEILTITDEQMAQHVQPGDMVICRKTAPLIKLCLQLIRQGIHARVKGTEIGKQLSNLVRKVEELQGYTWEDFPHWLNLYRDLQIKKLSKREGNEQAIANLTDRIECVQSSYDGMNATSTDDLCQQIEALFTSGKPVVMLATVHRSKGDEADRVFILYPNYLPLTWPGQESWEYQQEMNLRYVALTRAKKVMVFVVEPDDPALKKEAV